MWGKTVENFAWMLSTANVYYYAVYTVLQMANIKNRLFINVFKITVIA